MKYFKQINLSVEEQLKNFIINDVTRRIDPSTVINQIRIKHVLPNDLSNIVNAELKNLGFPKLLYCQSYIREKGNVQGIHIDGDNESKINAAINIPISGTAGSMYNWYTGTYHLNLRKIGDLVFHHIVWNSEPILATSLELDQPYLVRVNEPHSAVAGDRNRWIFTMRFVGNPTFEYLYDILSAR
jgi:hypothetical protein